MDEAVVSLRAGTSLVGVRPEFSHDSKYLFCCCGCVVKVYSTVSGECIRELQEHKKLVTGVRLNPHNKLQIFTSSLDGDVICWDYQDGVVLKKFYLSYPIQGLVGVSDDGRSVYVIRQLSQSTEPGYDLIKYICRPNKDGETPEKPMQVIFKSCEADSSKAAIGHQEEYVACVVQNRLKIWTPKKEIIHSTSAQFHFTCVMCHPVERCIITGRSDGQIHLWWSFLNPRTVSNTVNHWHSQAVGGICFTPEGSQFLSGGEECVMVQWQYNSHHKNFLPRLGAPIKHLTCSPDGSLCATGHSDNSVLIITDSFQIRHAIVGLTRGWRRSDDGLSIPTGLLCDPRTKSLVMNGKPGHLQFYSLHQDRHLFNLDIVGQNYVSADSKFKPAVFTEITRAAFSQSGTWLATVECWADSVFIPEIRLKLWCYSDKSQSFVLNTSIEYPHDKDIYSLKFRPQMDVSSLDIQLVTTGSDRCFKLWLHTDDTDIYRSNTKWISDSVGFYRDMLPSQADFSEDGSVLAVAFEYVVTLWDPDSNVLRTILVNPQDTQPIQCLAFGHQTSSHFLVSASESNLSVWNILTCAVQWSVAMDTSALVMDPRTDIFAVVNKENAVNVFNTSQPSPIFTHKAVSSSPVVSGIFLPHKSENSPNEGTLSWQKSSQLYLFTKDQELLSLEHKDSLKNKQGSKKAVMTVVERPTQLFGLLLAEKRIQEQREEAPVCTGLAKENVIKEILNSYAPLTALCENFMMSMLVTNDGAQGIQLAEDKDDEMEVDDEETPDDEVPSD